MARIILVDPSESRHLPSAFLSQVDLCNVESATGADVVLSVWDAPFTTSALVEEHTRRGLPVQIKRGSDVVASRFDERLYRQLGRMKELSNRPTLLFVGHAEPSKSGALTIDGKTVHLGRDRPVLYQTFVTIIENWQDMGGYWFQIPSQRVLAGWCNVWLDRLEKPRGHRFAKKKTSIDLFLQSNQEATIASLAPGIGVERARSLWNALEKQDCAQTLLQAIIWITSEPPSFKIHGWGKKLRSLCREALGLEEGQEITMVWKPPQT